MRIEYFIHISFDVKSFKLMSLFFTQTKRTKKAGIVGKYGKYLIISIYDL